MLDRCARRGTVISRPDGCGIQDIESKGDQAFLLQVSIELAAVPELQPSASFDQIRELTSLISTQSTAPPLFRELTSSGEAEFVIVNLGSISKPRWLTSRLYIFAVMFERMRGIRSIVFVESTDEKRHSYVGCAVPATVRRALGIRYPWLEQAYASAYTNVSAEPGFQILPQWGTLPRESASKIVQQFLTSNFVRMWPAPNQLIVEE